MAWTQFFYLVIFLFFFWRKWKVASLLHFLSDKVLRNFFLWLQSYIGRIQSNLIFNYFGSLKTWRKENLGWITRSLLLFSELQYYCIDFSFHCIQIYDYYYIPTTTGTLATFSIYSLPILNKSQELVWKIRHCFLKRGGEASWLHFI
jgi:hypothetical protein